MQCSRYSIDSVGDGRLVHPGVPSLVVVLLRLWITVVGTGRTS